MMNKRLWKFTRLFLFFGCIATILVRTPLILVEEVTSLERPVFETIDSKAFITKNNFYQTLSRQSIYETSGQLVGGILPHHDVASYMMADFYGSLAKGNQPEIIFLIGPNHYKRGERCQVGAFNFNTYSGTLSSNEEILTQLIGNSNIYKGTYEVFKVEHSINIHMNYIDYYFDDITVVPLILKENFDQKDLVPIAQQIKEVSQDKNVFYLASVDFSHYLPLDEANKRDQKTSKVLTEFNTDQLITLNDEHVDCPSAITLLLKILGQDQLRCTIYDHNNSAIILQNPDMEETTSYFSVIYSME